MKKIFQVLGLLLLTAPLLSQTIEEGPNGKWGVVDFDSELIIPYAYDEIKASMVKPLMIMKKDGLYGVVSDKGKVMIPFQYEQMLEDKLVNPTHRKNLFAVMKNGKIGMVDLENKPVLPIKFDDARVPVPNLIFGYTKGDSVLQVYNTQGKFLYKIPGKAIESCRRCYGVFKVEPVRPKAPVMSYRLDGTPLPMGSIVFANGYIIIQQGDKRGVMNEQGEWLFPCEYRMIYHGATGQFILEKSDTASMVADNQKKIIIPMGNQTIQSLGSLYKVSPPHSFNKTVYDSTGAILLPSTVYSIQDLPVDERFAKRPNQDADNYFLAFNKTLGAGGVYQKNGRMVLPPQYQNVQYCSDDHPLLAGITSGGRSRRIIKINAFDFEGKQILPDDYEYLGFTTNPGVLIGSKDGRTLGIVKIADQGASAVFEYDSIRYLSGNYFGLKKNGLWQLFSPAGTKIGKDVYLSLRDPDKYEHKYFPQMPRFKGELAVIVQKAEKTGPFIIGVNDRGKEYKLDIGAARARIKPRAKDAPKPEIYEMPADKGG